jgi:tRNA-specific adenosine deaminase 3
MRAIALVGRRRRELAGAPSAAEGPDVFMDAPRTRLEEKWYGGSALPPGGYLCEGLVLFITHEPCVMCAMAILHSRFGGVVFGRALKGTGALCAERRDAGGEGMSGEPENGLAYGLFWRRELNWRMLAWQWVEEGEADKEDGGLGGVHA